MILSAKTGLPYQREEEIFAKLAIIVPFRDNAYQKRSKQLSVFIPFMNRYLTELHHRDFVILVVEQSHDGRKFNRGKLLNVGFMQALDMGCDYCIFHDVDLLPDRQLFAFYGQYPDTPIHLAANWNKYRHLEGFFGGACSFNMRDFVQVNGFPNNFWGWGAEDDELYLRTVERGLRIVKPRTGSYVEMKHIHSKKISSLVNPERDFLLQDRNAWKGKNGLSDLETVRIKGPYQFLRQKAYCSRVEI